jgi:regulator of protease activity HflC (stomatin/prohibitin superfamily)
VLAQASQRAIEMVTSAVQDKELPVMYLLGERYIDAVKQLAASDNSKLVLVPGDIQASIRGVLGKG